MKCYDYVDQNGRPWTAMNSIYTSFSDVFLAYKCEYWLAYTAGDRKEYLRKVYRLRMHG